MSDDTMINQITLEEIEFDDLMYGFSEEEIESLASCEANEELI